MSKPINISTTPEIAYSKDNFDTFIKDKFHVGVGEQVGAFFKNRGVDLVKMLAGLYQRKIRPLHGSAPSPLFLLQRHKPF